VTFTKNVKIIYTSLPKLTNWSNTMLLQELKNQVRKLPVSDRLELLRSIIDSIQETPISTPKRSQAISHMRGLLKTNQPSPTDAEVGSMLEQHCMEKYL